MTEEPLFDDLLPAAAPLKRSIPVAIICVLYTAVIMTIGVLTGLNFLHGTRTSGPVKTFIVHLLALTLILGIVAAVWRMQKWAALLFIFFLVVYGGWGITVSHRFFYVPLVHVCAGIVVATQLRKMR